MLGSDATVASSDASHTHALAPLQRGMLFETLRTEDAAANVNQLVCTLREALDVAAFTRAWEFVAGRHEALRTAFRWESVPLAEVAAEPAIALHEEDWRGDDADARMRAFLRADRARGLALDRAPLFRLALFRTADAEYRLVWTVHHTIMDGATFRIVLPEVYAAYRSYARAVEPALPPAPQYREHVAWLERQRPDASEAFWRARLADVALPTPLPAARTEHAGERTRMDAPIPRRRLSDAVSAAVHRCAREHGVTLTTIAQAAWALLLARYSATSDVVFGATRACRRHGVEDAERIVGLFVNTLPLRVRVDPDAALGTWLRSIRTHWSELGSHEQTPLPLIAQWAGAASGTPLFESILVTHAERLEDGLRADCGAAFWRDIYWTEQTDYALAVHVTDAPQIDVRISADPRRYDGDTVDRLLDTLCAALAAIASHGEGRVGDIDLVTAQGRAELLGFNAAATPRPHASVHALFAEQARLLPDVVAAQLNDRAITYGALARRARVVASRLQRAGVRRGDRVALCAERSFAMLAGVLGILEAGAAYVPLDPGYPKERLRVMLGDAAPTAIVVHEPWTGLLAELLPCDAQAARVIVTDHASGEDGDDAPLTPVPVREDDPAYVMYTSGSTGAPKGVVVPHRAIVRLVCDADYVRLDEQTVLAAFAPPAFDASTFEVFAPLLNGGRLVLAPPGTPSLHALAALVARHRVTTLFLTTALFEQLGAAELAQFGSVRELFFGGDVASPERVARVLGLLPACRIVNVYGPTENTTFTTAHTVHAPLPPGPVPIGKPIANTTVYVLDERRRLVPVGAPGELCTGGDGVALGYLHGGPLDGERFVDDPFAARAGARMYRTGDVARWRADGVLEFLGRRDEQVKIRGFRVEPGEIEETLRTHGGVRDAIVVARGDADGGKRLVAYVVPHADQRVEPRGLRERLRTILPAHLVPAAIVPVAQLPLTPAGKVDRRALPDPGVPDRDVRAQSVAPRTLTERILARIWARTLDTQACGVDDDFFACGGDSLRAMRFMGEVHDTFAIDVPLREFFERPTIAQLAQALTRREPDADRNAQTCEPFVAVRPQGTRTPFVLVHGDLKSGGYYCYALARRLDREQPLYVFEPHGTDGAPLPTSIEAMADDYVGRLRAVQPRGPYRLGGYCGGGLVALEMARRLRDAGESVERLVLIESDGSNARYAPLASLVSRLAAALRMPSGGEGITAACVQRLRLAARLGTFDAAAWRALARRKARDAATAFAARRAPEDIVAHWQRAIWRYVPRPYHGPMLALFASERAAEPPAYVAPWRGVGRDVEIRPLPGDHFTCITRHIDATAAVLDAYLSDALP